MRLRWFRRFAKFERAVILKRYRSLGLFIPVHRSGRGVRPPRRATPKAYLHAQQRLWPIMERQGFRKVDDKVFHFSDHEYGAFCRDLDVDAKTRPTRSSPIRWC